MLIWINFSSSTPIRGWNYELFVVQHVVSFGLLIGFVYVHAPPELQGYVWAAVASSSSIESAEACGSCMPTYPSSIHHRTALDCYPARPSSCHYLTTQHESRSRTRPSAGAPANTCSCHVRASPPCKITRSQSHRYPKTARCSFWSKRIPGEQGASSNMPRNRRAWLIHQQGMYSHFDMITTTDHPLG